jgi:hypothetical protein
MARTRAIVAAIVAAVFASVEPGRAQTAATADGWVVLPVDEYRALRERAQPAPPPAPALPVDATLTRVDYELRVDSDAVVGRAVLTIDVLKDGWTRVRIPAGLMVREARLDGQPLALVEAPPQVLLSRPGRAIVTLDLVVPLVVSAGAESIGLPPSPAPITRAALVLPKSGVDLSVTGGFVAEHADSANESRWTAFGRANQPLTLAWKRKADDRRAEQPLRVRARITEVVGLGEDACQVTAAARVEVLQGLAREVALALPPGLVVNQVTGATVGDWDASDGSLRVRLLEPSASEISFVVQAEARVARDGPIAVPLVRMPSAERESGGVAVDVVGAGEIGERAAQGLDPADPADLGDIVSSRESPSMVAFRLRPLAGGAARSLTTTVVRYSPQAVLVANVEEARYRALASEDGRLLVEARYAVRNNQRSFLKVTLPADATVWSAEVAGRPIRPGVAERDGVLLPLEKGRAGEEAPTFVVRLVYLQRVQAWSDGARARVELPAIDLPISRTGLELHYSPRFRVEPQPGSFRVDSDPGPYAEALRDANPTAGPVSAAPIAEEQGIGGGLQRLVDRFRNESVGRLSVGSLPVHVTFPSVGPSLFLASELTAEASGPFIELAVRRASR